MSDASSIPEGPFEQSEEPSQGKPGLLDDPVVRVMVYALIGLVILFLATTIGVLVTGVLATNGPRSAAEQQIVVASAAGTTGEAAYPYISALIAAGDLPAARIALAQARASVGTTAPVSDLDLAEARLFTASKDYEQAVSVAEKAMKGYKAEYDAQVALVGKSADAPVSAALSSGYYNSALVKAYALVELRRWKDAVAAFDIYILQIPTAADVLIDRGNAKAELNDKAGAEKDFREALRFGPNNPEAKAGLKRIGVAQ